MKFAQSTNMKIHEKKMHTESKTGQVLQEVKEDLSPFLDIKLEPLEIESDPLEIKSEPLENEYS